MNLNHNTFQKDIKNTFVPISIIILIFIAITIYRFNSFYASIPDDTFIYFRYAHNIANGFGFVYNINSLPVEGYSSFLYLMVLTLFEFIGVKAINVFVYLGVVSNLLSLLVISHYFLRILKVSSVTALTTILLIILTPNFLYYTTSGMETSLYSFLVITSVVITVKSYLEKRLPFLVGFMWALTSLARFEASAIFLFLLVINLLLDVKSQRIDSNYYYKLLMGFAVIFIPYFIWRWDYFGQFFPNTYYDKTGGGFYQFSGGVLYVLDSFRQNFGGTSVILFFFLIFISKQNLKQYEVYTIGFLIIFYSFVIIILGGDHFGYGRFLTPVFLLFFLLVGLGIENFFNIVKFKKFIVIPTLLFICACISFRSLKVEIFPISNKSTPYFDNGIKDYNWIKGFALMGKALKKIEVENKTIALVPIGAIGYYSDYEIFDMLGLVDPVIANQEFDKKYIKTWRPGHDKGDGKYILSKKPYFIQLTDYITKDPQKNPGNFNLQYKSVSEIWESEDFHNNYEFFPIKISGGYYNLYRRVNNL